MNIPHNSLMAMIVIFGLLAIGSLSRFMIEIKNPEKDYTELKLRIQSWWWMIAILFAFISFFALLIKPIVFVVLGLNIRGKNNLPQKGPAIIAANHNSHLDSLLLLGIL